MTRIIFYEKEGLFTALEISGHTGKAESGKDILCAAISTASQMVVVGLQDELKLKPFVDVYDGYLKIKINNNDIDKSGVQLLMKTCYDTLKQIVKNQKKYVDMEVKEDV